MKEIICIVCPKGCHIKYNEETDEFSNFVCKRGPEYAKKELTNPTRILTTTVEIKDSICPRLPVVTSQDIPKTMIFECIKALTNIEVQAPIKVGDVIVENILNLGVDIVATKTVEKL